MLKKDRKIYRADIIEIYLLVVGVSVYLILKHQYIYCVFKEFVRLPNSHYSFTVWQTGLFFVVLLTQGSLRCDVIPLSTISFHTPQFNCTILKCHWFHSSSSKFHFCVISHSDLERLKIEQKYIQHLQTQILFVHDVMCRHLLNTSVYSEYQRRSFRSSGGQG